MEDVAILRHNVQVQVIIRGLHFALLDLIQLNLNVFDKAVKLPLVLMAVVRAIMATLLLQLMVCPLKLVPFAVMMAHRVNLSAKLKTVMSSTVLFSHVNVHLEVALLDHVA